MRRFEERVSRGVALLDERKPNWRELIDTKKLDMTCQYNCILGQVYRSYMQGLSALFTVNLSFDHACNHGFHLPVGSDRDNDGFDELAEEWKRHIPC